jgi:hypothetical protein
MLVSICFTEAGDSIAHQGTTLDCAVKSPKPLVLSEDKENSVTYTYTISWEVSPRNNWI